MWKHSKLGLVFAGAYAAFSLAALGCARYCVPVLDYHGNFYLTFVPLVPADILLRWIRLGGLGTFGVGSMPEFVFVVLVTLSVFYAAGWLIGKIAAALFGAARKSARAQTPGPD